MKRTPYIDNLRVFLTLLVITHHTAIAYGAEGSWYFEDPGADSLVTSLILTLMAAVNQSFFMGLFFLISAYFTPGSYDRKGPWRFLKDRALRLGVPLLVYFFLLNPLLIYLLRRYRGDTATSVFAFFRDHWLDTTGTGPLWFVLSLLLLAVTYVVIRLLSRRRSAIAWPMPSDSRIVAFCITVGIVTFGVRLIFPTGWEVLGLQFGYFTLYLCLFGLGLVARHSHWLEGISAQTANRWFRRALFTIFLLPVALMLGGALEGRIDAFAGGWTWQALSYALWEPFVCVGICLKLLQAFRDRWNRAGPLLRAAARSAYTAYILHPFFVVGSTMALVPWAAPPALKFAVAVPLASATCFLLSDLVRRVPVMQRIL